MNDFIDSILGQNFNLMKFSGLSAVISIIFVLITQSIRWCFECVYFFICIKFVPIKIPIPKESNNSKNVKFCVLLRRFGTEKYLSSGVCTQKELEHGKLRLWIIPVYRIKRKHSPFLFFFLPVHKRLGVQFKMFVDLPDDEVLRKNEKLTINDRLMKLKDDPAFFSTDNGRNVTAPIIELLEKSVTKSLWNFSNFRYATSVPTLSSEKARVYFLLDHRSLMTIETFDGHINNFLFYQ